MIRISVMRTSEDGLTREMWWFNFFDNRASLVLDDYRAEVKKTKRHGWVITKDYSRIRQGRDWNLPLSAHLDKPPLPQDVADEALKQFTSQITVTME